jgi:Domain of unknown function (DUF4440)
MRLILCVIIFFYNANLNAQHKLLQIDRQRYDLMIAQDTASLSSMIAPSLVYIHSNGMIDTKQSLLESIGTKTLVHKSISTSEDKVRVYRKRFAIVTGKAIYNINYHNEDMTLNFVYTNVYYKLKGHWILISRQTSPLKI